jgi:phospho-N-acetylmuramoyl-pentapeptide-transferase
MLLKYFYPLVKYATFFNIFQYITFRAIYAAITSLLISFIAGPWLIERLTRLKLGQSIRQDGPASHLEKSGTPTMGGLLIVLSVVTAVLLWQDLANPFTWILLLAAVGYGSIGFIDDILKITKRNARGLRASLKLAAQVLLATGIVLVLYSMRGEHTTLLYLPFLKNPALDLGYLYIPLAVLLLVGYSNAVNFTDGLDGLAAGLVIFVGLTFALLSYLTGRVDWTEYFQIPLIENSGEITVLCLALVGACVGFLWFNAHPAHIMMGDTGSLALGGILGVIALIIKKEILLIVVGGVFVIEMLSVVIQVIAFKITGRRVFKMAPLHHHFELAGWKESKVVIRFWILGGLFALIGLSTLKIQ